MQFVYPQFLYALGFIAVPIIIHLFNLVKPKKVVFSNIKFLKQVELKSSRKIRLKHILILISRILFITVLVLLFAQPIIPSNNNTGKSISNHASIYLDNSLSMSAYNNDEQNFSYAIKELNAIIDKYPTSTRFQLIDNDFKPNSLFYFKKEKVKDMLTEVELSSKIKSAQEIYKRQQSLKKNNNIEELDIIWISDFQQSVFSDVNKIEKDSSITHYMFNLESANQSNVYVDSVYFPSPFIRKGENTELTVVLRNSSAKSVDNLSVKIVVDNKELANSSIAINGNSKEEIILSFVLDEVGEENLTISIANDDIDFDNEFYFTLTIESELNMLIITDSTSSLVARVFDNEKIFNSTVSQSGSVDYGEINKFDLIVLDHLKEVKPSLSDQLSRQLYNTSVVVIPNRKFDVASYQGLFNKLACNVLIKETREKEMLAPPVFKNPFFKGVFDKEDKKINMPEITSILNPINASNIILKTQSGNVAFAEYNAIGKTYVFSGALKEPQSNFLRHSLIVPLMYKMAMNSSNKNRELYSTVNGSFKNISITDSIKSIYSLKNKELQLIPDQKIINNKLQLNLNVDEFSSGFYQLMKGEKSIKTLAVNLEKSESILESVETEVINKLSDNNAKTSQSSLSDEFEKLSVGTSLWRYCLYLALLFLLVEIVLIRFYKT